jgi:ribosomal protein RSM22 (predicted rRNA methylase)
MMSTKINSLFDTSKIPQDAVKIIQNFDQIVQNVRPLNSKQLQQLPENIRALSHQMTDERADRRLGYMNENIQLSSYVRYFTWWNLVRLSRLFANLPAESLPQGEAVCLDLGSGPLTVVTALFLARPELRKQKLVWYCLDVSANSMALGEDVFLSVCAKLNEQPWQIIRVKGSFGTSIKQKASFITCANMFNELDQSSDMPPEFKVKKYYDQLMRYASEEARFLLIEPGVPKAARTLALLRDRFIKGGYFIASPCSHQNECPMSGFRAYTGSKNKWCNFAFETTGAPDNLIKLSERAKLPKERATLSFIAVVPERVEGRTGSLIRITSDEFRLPNYMSGFYACTEYGLALVQVPSQNNTRLPKPPFRPASGDLIDVKKITPDSLPKDEKSGAIVIKL